MKPPKIPFMPLLLKGHLRICMLWLFYLHNPSLTQACSVLLDITFIHEGNKTFHDNLVNFEKLVSWISELSLCLRMICQCFTLSHKVLIARFVSCSMRCGSRRITGNNGADVRMRASWAQCSWADWCSCCSRLLNGRFFECLSRREIVIYCLAIGSLK